MTTNAIGRAVLEQTDQDGERYVARWKDAESDFELRAVADDPGDAERALVNAVNDHLALVAKAAREAALAETAPALTVQPGAALDENLPAPESVHPLDAPATVAWCEVHAPQLLNRRKVYDQSTGSARWVWNDGHKLLRLP